MRKKWAGFEPLPGLAADQSINYFDCRSLRGDLVARLQVPAFFEGYK